jgi:hypothetical protein
VLIADAPPHGLEPTGDGFPNGDPEGRDPLEIARQMAASGITVYAVGCEPALGSYRFARDFMCSLAEITGGQAVALSSAERLADVIINGSAEEISLTRLTREVEEEVERVRIAAPEPLDEEELQMRACSNLKSRGVKSKQMRHDGAMMQKNATVWKASSSLAAAKMELCKTVEGGSLEMMDEGDLMPDELSRSATSFSTPSRSRAARGLSWMMSPLTGGSAESTVRSRAPALKKKAAAPMRSRAMPRDSSSLSAAECEAMPAARGFGGIAASAPVEEKSLKSNVLVEDEISFDQVKRIMARKSAK